MRVITDLSAMRAACKSLQEGAKQTIGLVPTMGALHEGHLSLVRASKQQCSQTVVSIFVNPLQFGPGEDLEKYPRTFEKDCDLLEKEEVDILFAPSPADMYPAPMQTFVDVPEIASRLDGASRPGHFRGVATVVNKLFQIVRPDHAFFGQKDAAQVAVLRTMVRDLAFDIRVVVCPTVRDQDGLALSSRNRYLSVEERKEALALSRALRVVEASVAAGERTASVLRDQLLQELTRSGKLRVDYAEIVDQDSLENVVELSQTSLAAVAAWIGDTRLIDNMLVTPAGGH